MNKFINPQTKDETNETKYTITQQKMLLSKRKNNGFLSKLN